MIPSTSTPELAPPPAEPKHPNHPGAFFGHFLFKALALVYYITCGWFMKDQFVINFVVVIVLQAMDFWVVKNITGRYLVGLRWWNEADDSGKTAWRFEKYYEGSRTVNPKESWWFWTVLLAAPIAWGALGLITLFRLNWNYLILPIIGVVLTYANGWGYWRCSKEAQQHFSAMGSNLMTSAFTKYATVKTLSPA